MIVAENGIEKKECAICFESIDDINTSTVKCGHTFHTTCLITWSISQANKNLPANCPGCRHTISSPPTLDLANILLYNPMLTRNMLRPLITRSIVVDAYRTRWISLESYFRRAHSVVAQLYTLQFCSYIPNRGKNQDMVCGTILGNNIHHDFENNRCLHCKGKRCNVLLGV